MPDTLKPREKRTVVQPESAEGERVGADAIKGKIDHAALTQRIIARFPKILAALAK